MINVFLDDCRNPPDNFILAKNASECRVLIQNNDINILSIDHDLGETETGYDLVKWLVEQGLYEPEIYPRVIYLHTANPVGRHNMYQLLMRYKPEYVRVHYGPMPAND